MGRVVLVVQLLSARKAKSACHVQILAEGLAFAFAQIILRKAENLFSSPHLWVKQYTIRDSLSLVVNQSGRTNLNLKLVGRLWIYSPGEIFRVSIYMYWTFSLLNTRPRSRRCAVLFNNLILGLAQGYKYGAKITIQQ